MSFEEERIDNPTEVTTGVTSDGMVVIPYIIGVEHPMRVVN